MIPLAANIPLTLCSVVLRRVLDHYTGRIPLAVASASAVPTASTVALFSGALICLYHQLRKGTLVNIGIGKRLSNAIRNSRHTIQRRVKNNSWFLRNIDSCRRKCAEAVLKIAQLPSESLRSVQAETGTVETGPSVVNAATSLPVFARNLADGRRTSIDYQEPLLENLYSNESFESNDHSNHDVRKSEPTRKRRSVHVDTTPHRPLTRNFKKAQSAEYDHCGDGRRLSSKNRKKADSASVEAQEEFHFSPAKIIQHQSLERKHIPKTIQKSKASSEEPTPAKVRVRRHSERLKTQQKIQKVTRKTRSGKVYAYRL